MTSLAKMLPYHLKLWLKSMAHHPSAIRWYRHWRLSLTNPMSLSWEADLPWVNYPTINWLQQHLAGKMRVFEWGSGASTFFFSKRVHSLISVEHDQQWYHTILDQVSKGRIANVTIFYIPPQSLTQKSQRYGSAAKKFEHKSFENYVNKILDFPDDHFDLIVIDGRARAACAEAAVPKLKPHGFLLLDDSDRPQYQSTHQLLAHWPHRKFTGLTWGVNNLLTETTIWEKK